MKSRRPDPVSADIVEFPADIIFTPLPGLRVWPTRFDCALNTVGAFRGLGLQLGTDRPSHVPGKCLDVNAVAGLDRVERREPCRHQLLRQVAGVGPERLVATARVAEVVLSSRASTRAGRGRRGDYGLRRPQRNTTPPLRRQNPKRARSSVIGESPRSFCRLPK